MQRRHKHWLPSIFELRQLRELTVTAGSTWVRLPQEFCHLTNLERLTIQMRIEGGYEPCQTVHVSSTFSWLERACSMTPKSIRHSVPAFYQRMCWQYNTLHKKVHLRSSKP